MINILIKFLKFLSIVFSKFKKFDLLTKKQTRFSAIILSLLLLLWQISNSAFGLKDWKIALILFFSFFIILDPFLYYFRYKILSLFSEHVFMALFLIIYFIILVPLLGELSKNFIPVSFDNFIIKFLHLLTILVSLMTILVIIIRQFLLIIFNKRKIHGIDILMTFATYLIIGFAFGNLYYLLNLQASQNLFSGVEKPATFIFSNYLNHIYISLGALSTVASGSITAANPYIRLLSVFETILGVFLTSFSLGFIFSIVGSNIATQNSELKNNDFNFWNFLENKIQKFKNDLEKKEKNYNIKE